MMPPYLPLQVLQLRPSIALYTLYSAQPAQVLRFAQAILLYPRCDAALPQLIEFDDP